MSTSPQLPVTSIEVLERDEELKYTVFTLLTSGWSFARISRHLFRTRGVALPVRDIRIFADELPPALILPPSYLRKKYLELDLQIDAVNVLAGIIRSTEEQIEAAVLAEEVGGSPGSTLVDRLTTQLFDRTERYVRLLQSLGDLPKAAEPIELRTGEVETHPTLREVLESREHGAKPEGSEPSSDVPA